MLFFPRCISPPCVSCSARSARIARSQCYFIWCLSLHGHSITNSLPSQITIITWLIRCQCIRTTAVCMCCTLYLSCGDPTDVSFVARWVNYKCGKSTIWIHHEKLCIRMPNGKTGTQSARAPDLASQIFPLPSFSDSIQCDRIFLLSLFWYSRCSYVYEPSAQLSFN